MKQQTTSQIILSMDIEVDMGNQAMGYIGVNEGLPRFLSFLGSFDISADFFVSTDVCHRFPKEIKRLLQKGYNVGNHGLDHRLLCGMGYEEQYQWLKESTENFEEILGSRPSMFRAPNFSANGNTIMALQRLGYSIDSSVLPGRVIRRFGFDPMLYKHIPSLRISDFSEAPEGIYRPSPQNIAKKGQSRIIEVPLSQNPLRRGSPISLGFLNEKGPKELLRAIEKFPRDYIILLCHSWELVDLGTHYKNLKERFRRECHGGTDKLEEFLNLLGNQWRVSNINALVADYLDEVRN